MAEIEKTEFEFPDEAEVNARKGGKVVAPESDEPEIEVIDDTPPEDRGRKPMSEPPRDVTDDELSKYDESVQKRIKHFTKGYHDERRAKESAEREREEALRFARSLAEENNKLKGSVNQNQTALIEQANLAEPARRLRHVAISHDCAQGLSGLGAGEICVAATPDGSAMAALLSPV